MQLAGSQRMWFMGRHTDFFLIFGAGPLIALALIFGVYWVFPIFIGSVLFAILIDLPHQVQTHVRLLANPDDFARYRRKFWSSLVIISSACVACWLIGDMRLPVTAWAYWQIYHVATQHFGVATLYSRRNGYTQPTARIKHLLLLGYACPILYRIAATGLQFGAPMSEAKVWMPRIPMLLVWAAYALFWSTLIRFIYKEWKDYRQGRGLPPFVLIMIGAVLLLYNIYFLLASDIFAFILIASGVHAMQYHLVVVPTAREASRRAITEKHGRLLMGLHRCALAIIKRRVLWANAIIIASLFIVIGHFLTSGVVPLVFAMHHYFLDGVIWKRRRKPSLANAGLNTRPAYFMGSLITSPARAYAGLRLRKPSDHYSNREK